MMKPVFLALFFSLIVYTSYGQKLYIFLPTEYRPVDIEKKFAVFFRGVDIRSFGSVIDFKRAVELDSPDAIITKPQLIPFLNRYSIKLNGTINGSRQEPFYLLSIGDPLLPKSLDDKNIGILDFLGRKNISSFITVLIDGNPKLQRVKNVADLLPLISLNIVDGLVVSSTQASYIKRRSKLLFNEAKCKKDQDIAALALAKENDEIVNALRKLPADLAQLIGVEGWN